MAKILIIDDEPGLRFIFRSWLEDFEHEVLEADNGAQGLNLIRAQELDIIFCDLRMPEVDGLEVLSTVSKEWPELPFVVISGGGVIQDVIEALRRGAWDYLLKPIEDMAILEYVIEKVLERARLLKIKREFRHQLQLEVQQRTRELQKTRKILQEQNELLGAVFKSLPMGTYYRDLQGEVINVNDACARMVGSCREELIGRNIYQALEGQDVLEKILSMNDSLLMDRKVQTFQTRLSVDKKAMDVLIRRAVVPDGQGHPVGYLVLVEDITDKLYMEKKSKEQEERLLQADKMISLGILAAGVAHEINNPNHLIMLNTPVVGEAWESVLPILDQYEEENGDFLLAGLPYSRMGRKISDLLKNIENGAERIRKIVYDMKNFSRLNPDEEHRAVDANKVIKDALALVNAKLRKCCSNLVVELNEDLPEVLGNELQLEQVMINLLLNSAESLPNPACAIRVATCLDEARNRVLMTVEDEGEGISEENMKNIRDPFFTTKRENGGTGLGLAISECIIQKHGGEIYFESETGRGTTASIGLPVSRSDSMEGNH